MIDYIEMRTQSHIMNAEGTATNEPCKEEIERAINRRGYKCKNISISHDGLHQIWRFTAKLTEEINDGGIVMSKVENIISIETVVQKELMKVAEKVYKEHGLVISDISFNWNTTIDGEYILLGCETRSSTINT